MLRIILIIYRINTIETLILKSKENSEVTYSYFQGVKENIMQNLLMEDVKK